MAFLRISGLVTGLLSLIASGPALAQQAADGMGHNWQLGFQEAVTPVMQKITEFHDLLLVIITLITLFVLALLLYVMFRFSEKRNPEHFDQA